MPETFKSESTTVKPTDSRHAPIPEYEFLELLLSPMEIGDLSMMGAGLKPQAQATSPWAVKTFAAVAAISFLLFHLCGTNFCDPEIWHEMAAFRQTMSEGRASAADPIAGTQTATLSNQHEWAAGAVFYTVATLFGAPGIMFLKFSLVATVVAACCWCTRMRMTSSAVFLTVAPAMALFSSYGFTTIRPQVFSLAMLAIMLGMLELDQRGRRWWIAAWLPLHMLWLNLHAGFVVGAVLMALHACEQIIRRGPFLHFIPVGIALAGLVLLNPSGANSLPDLMQSLSIAQPLSPDWQSLWQSDAGTFCLFLLSFVPIVFAGQARGWRRLPGALVLTATALAAAWHTCHLPYYCVAWLCYVPGYLQQTKFGQTIEDFFQREGKLVMQVCLVVTAIWLSRVASAAPWELVIPSTKAQAEQGIICYPVGAVEYLKQAAFQGNLILPSEVSGYAQWKLPPQAKVRLNGQGDAAVKPGILEERLSLYRAEPGWDDILTIYSPDAILVPCTARLSTEMPSRINWRQTYCDGVYSIYSRSHLNLPISLNAQADPPVSFP